MEFEGQTLSAKIPLVSLTHWPNIDFFCLISQSEKTLIEAHENFQKQSYRNRLAILMSNGQFSLTIPVKNGRKKLSYQQIEIDYSQNWIRNYLGTLQTAYGKSPYFEYFNVQINSLMQAKPQLLFELNQKILTFCLDNLKINQSKVLFSETYIDTTNQAFTDLRTSFSTKHKENKLTIFQQKPYSQTFGNDFVANLSIIDLLCNLGPQAKNYLSDQKPTNII